MFSISSRSIRRSLAAAAMVLLIAPTAAQAYVTTTSWQGNDRSTLSATARSITVYDGENDSRAVKAEWYQSGDSSMKLLTNGKGWDTSASTSTSTAIKQHRTVEIIALRPDAVGKWYSTTTGKVIP